MSRKFFVLFLLLGVCRPIAAQQNGYNTILSPSEMTDDFNYLRKMVEATMPALYIHQTVNRVNFLFDSVKNTLREPLSFLEFYRRIAFIIAEVRCEHSYANMGNAMQDFVKQSYFLPFQLDFSGKHPIVIINGTTDTTIKPGDALQSINGRPIDSIQQELYKYIPADGFITTSKAHALSSMQFNLLYAMFIEQAKAYEVVVKNRSGQLIRRHFTKGLNFKDINKNALKNPVNTAVLEASNRLQIQRKEDLSLEFMQQGAAAFLTVRSFSVDKQVFKNKIDTFFSQIKENRSRNLVIDLSYNGGGEEELAAYLMSYLVSSPTKFVDSEYLITDKDEYLRLANIPEKVRKNKYAYIDTLREGKSLAKISEYARELETMQPQANHFTGKVYLYVNGATSSAASTFAAVAQSNKKAVIIGQETAGSFKGGGAVIGLDLTLPNSGIKTHTSMVYVRFATHGRDGNRGVVPDFNYVPGFDEMIGNEDVRGWKKYVMRLF